VAGKLVKNVKSPAGLLDLRDVGVRIPASGTYLIPEQDYMLWAASVDIQNEIAAGNAILNDGVEDLSLARSADYIRHSERAFSVRFDSDPERVNGFVSRNVQEAIEESRNAVAGKIVTLSFASNGTTADKWLFVAHPTNTSDTSPYVVPWSGKIIALSYSNSENSSETDLKLYVNGSLQYTWDIRNRRTSWISDSGGLATLAQGDRVSVYASTVSGTSPKDINGMILASLITQPNGEGGTASGV